MTAPAIELPTAVTTRPAAGLRRHGWARVAMRVVVLLLALAIVTVAIREGLRLRRWAWEQTYRNRFVGDIANAYRWGTEAARVGYLCIYSSVERDAGPDRYMHLDYPPGRLLIMTQWVRWTQSRFPDAAGWQPSYAFNAPLLWFNNGCELAAAVAMFLLVRVWVARSAATAGLATRRWFSWRALVAALLLWFNPAVIWNAHVWPQWEVWLVPFFLFAAFFASVNWWFMAGVMLALGALLKGQMLLVAPLLLLWPLLQGRVGAAARCALGLACAGLAAVSPWLVGSIGDGGWALSRPAAAWLACVAAAMALVYPWSVYGRIAWWWRLALLPAALGLVLWPAWRMAGSASVAGLLVAGGLGMTQVRTMPARWFGYWLGGAISAALLLCVPLFGGGLSWYVVGYEYGTRHYQAMHMGHTFNLSSLLERSYGWRRPSQIVWRVPWGGSDAQEGASGGVQGASDVTIKALLAGIYFLSLLLCAIGAGRHERRCDGRVLVALAAPWLLFFAFMPQMHERYLVPAAAITAAAAGVSTGLVLVHLLITALAWIPMLYPSGLPLVRYLHPLWPDLSWLSLLCAAIFLYGALVPQRRAPMAGAELRAGARKHV